jgi:catechol 2,3-dioxygenase-like lactoylglutathione lyase family enzyme
MPKKKPAARRAGPALTDVSRVIFYVKDTERSARWYSEVLGVPVRHQEPGWVELETTGVSLCLHGGRESGLSRDASQVGFRVPNFEPPGGPSSCARSRALPSPSPHARASAASPSAIRTATRSGSKAPEPEPSLPG